MDNNQDYCSYELSKTLKAAGFNWPCDHCYAKTSDSEHEFVQMTTSRDYNKQRDGEPSFLSPICSAVPLWQAQKWLREKKGIYAYCEPNCLKKWFARAIDLAKNEDLLFDGEMFDSFEKATEYAISAALELIKKGE